MKVFSPIVALCAIGSAAAFTPSPLKRTVSSNTALSEGEDFNMFPLQPRFETIQGGGTVKTYQMPPWATRCQYVLKTNGRPLKATVELWLGPLRRTHNLIIDNENGAEFPYQATLKFKKMAQVLKICTSETLELPVMASVSVPSPEEAKALEENTEAVFDAASPSQKKLIQGGAAGGGGGGAIRSWDIPPDVDAVQILAWARDTGKKSFRMDVEILKGPNNIKQKFMLQCGGGSQPYHSVVQTPGQDWVVRIRNKKFVEDGLYQFCVIPYNAGGSQAMIREEKKEWWQ